jgi:hypothetical protein
MRVFFSSSLELGDESLDLAGLSKLGEALFFLLFRLLRRIIIICMLNIFDIIAAAVDWNSSSRCRDSQWDKLLRKKKVMFAEHVSITVFELSIEIECSFVQSCILFVFFLALLDFDRPLCLVGKKGENKGKRAPWFRNERAATYQYCRSKLCLPSEATTSTSLWFSSWRCLTFEGPLNRLTLKLEKFHIELFNKRN